MNTSQELTIVIPAKNEAELLPRLLDSIAQQDTPGISETTVYVADASSTDGTVELALNFRGRIDVRVIAGGLPSAGRNAGARMAQTPYVLFIDADIELEDPTLIRRAIEKMKRRNLHCLTTHIWCKAGSWKDQALYLGNNIVQFVSQFGQPFSTGMFMLFDRKRFEELGGFHEQALYAEDYLLSKKVARRRFGIVRGKALTTNRRFRKMGHIKIMGMFFKTALNTWNDNYFLRDHHYWHS